MMAFVPPFSSFELNPIFLGPLIPEGELRAY
jgi:hypothetical protein